MISFIRSIKADWRLFKLRRIHSGAKLYSNVVLDDLTSLERNVVLFSGVNLSESCIGRSTYIQSYTYCHNAKIGPFCSIASNVVIGLVNHPLDCISTSPVFYDDSQPLPYFLINGIIREVCLPKTEIGADVWICHGAKIMAGVKIGVGAVVAAGAVVTKDVAPYEIVGGVPAKFIKFRFENKLVEKLVALKWWESSHLELKKLAPYFSNPERFIYYFEKLK